MSQITTNKTYSPDSVGSILSDNVLAVAPTDKLEYISKSIIASRFDDIQYAYVLDNNRQLIGMIDLARVIKTDAKIEARHIMTKPVTIHPHADQEEAVVLSIKNDLTAVPVVDKNGVFLGAVSARTIIDVMHSEHLEDALLTAGVRRGRGGMQIAKLATSRTRQIFKMRAPWLIFGLAVSLGLGLITSFFEASLQETIALAYFIPVVAYIADSVGTQSEAIAVRALALLKVNFWKYLMKELLVGLLLGALMGVLGGVGAAVIGQSVQIGIIVALSLFVASTVAALLASLVPIIFKLRGKDPALGSGPLSTALQDVVSIVIYFIFAVIIL